MPNREADCLLPTSCTNEGCCIPIPVTCRIPTSFGPLVVGDTCKPGMFIESGKSCDVKCDAGASAISGVPTYTCDAVTKLGNATLTCGKRMLRIGGDLFVFKLQIFLSLEDGGHVNWHCSV